MATYFPSPPPPCSPCAQGCRINHFPHLWEVPTLRHNFPSYAAYLDMSEENGKETGNAVARIEWLPDRFPHVTNCVSCNTRNPTQKTHYFKPSHSLLIRLWPLGSNQGFGALIHKDQDELREPLATLKNR